MYSIEIHPLEDVPDRRSEKREGILRKQPSVINITHKSVSQKIFKDNRSIRLAVPVFHYHRSVEMYSFRGSRTF